jgi:nitrite reductase/ring-hydroxylating ferredoxin subunit
MQVIMAEKQVKGFIRMNKFLIVTCLAISLSACKDDSVNPLNDFFPPVQVNLMINLSLPTSAPLIIPQGFIYEQGGNRGIIIYRTIANEYVAYDRTCPYNVNEPCSYISVDSSLTFFRCGQYNPAFNPCCGSKFDPATGTNVSGPATRGLKPYFVRQEGNLLYVTNNP